MMPITRQEIEVLLDSPERHDYVVSAYADLSVQNGFERYAEQHLKNQARAAAGLLAGTGAGHDLAANLDAVREAVRGVNDPQARGVAVFSNVAKGLRHVVAVDFPVENRLVIDEEPFVLPLLERWHGDPTFLVALVDSDEAHFFEARHGTPEPVGDLVKQQMNADGRNVRPRFSYKKQFTHGFHEKLKGAEDDKFFKEMADALSGHWAGHRFDGLILLGQPHVTGPLRKLLPRELNGAVAGEAAHAMTTRPDEIAGEVGGMIEAFSRRRRESLLAELANRWKEKHLVAGGPTDVLDALQQGRAERVFLGNRRDIPGARCTGCQYRLGAPVRNCPYCGSTTRTVNAAQDVMRLALRHNVPVHVLTEASDKLDPVAPYGDVAALLVAPANWAPDPATAAASEGRTGS